MRNTTHVDRRVVLALRLADGKWCLYSTDEKRLSKVPFKTAKMAAEAGCPFFLEQDA